MGLKKHITQGISIFTLASSLLVGGLYNDGTLQAEIVVAGSIDEIAPEVISRQFTSEVINLHKTLCQTAKKNRQEMDQKGKNVLVFVDSNGITHTLFSGRKNVERVLEQNEKTRDDYMEFIQDTLGYSQQTSGHHGQNDYFHTEILLVYAIRDNLTIDGVPCEQLISQDLHICSFKDMCANCEKILQHLSSQFPEIKIIVSSLKPYKFKGEISRNENEQFGSLKITDNFFKFAFYDIPKHFLPIDWDSFLGNPE